MSKKALAIILIIVLLIGGGTAYLLLTKDAKTAKQNLTSSTVTKSTEPEPANSENTSGQGQYLVYKEGAVQNTQGTKLLFFYAPWCPQCRAIEADINKKGAPQGVTIFKLDYDTNQPLRQKYGVTIQTTFVKVDDDGNLISKFVAYDDPTLDSVVKNIL